MDIEIKALEGAKLEAQIGTYVIKSDQSQKDGGQGTAPNPFEYFAASVGLCATHYLNEFCKQRNIPTEEMKVTEKVSRNTEGKVVFTIELKLPKDFPQKYKDAIAASAGSCAVKKAIESQPVFEMKMV
jgi:ribosomal protein S12 methylthiotransferase accessory factor